MNKNKLLRPLLVSLITCFTFQGVRADNCPSFPLGRHYFVTKVDLEKDNNGKPRNDRSLLKVTTVGSFLGAVKHQKLSSLDTSHTKYWVQKRFAIQENCGELTFKFPIYLKYSLSDDNFQPIGLFSDWVDFNCQARLNSTGKAIGSCSFSGKLSITTFISASQNISYYGQKITENGTYTVDFNRNESGPFNARPISKDTFSSALKYFGGG